MKTIRCTLQFGGSIVHTIYHQVEDGANLTRLRDQLEGNTVVLKMQEADEPDYKALWKESEAQRKELGRQLADALKKLNAATVDEKPCFGVFHP
jgi:hypothetical protein